MKKNVYIVPHSHWDREWYFTIEDSNVLLSQNMPYLMDVLENDNSFNSYTFDAQASIIEEFLKVYPEQKERLKRLVEEKRIFVGPWYTQTDSLLVNTESIIRNLLYGTRITNDLGYFLKVGYLPDIFGQNAYLPSIFKGFGINDSILQRGIYTEDLRGNLNFKWTSPDGETVNANNIYLGYGPGKFLASDDIYINEKLIPMLEKLEDLNKDSNNLLLPSGGDQVLVRKEFPKIIKELNEKVSDYNFILSDYESFMKDTFEETEFRNEIKGELIASQKSRIHNTIKSQRYDIKRLNTIVENKIINILEPLSIIGKSFNLKYPRYWIDYIWKELFDVHAHDSIGGCNSDDTNRNILNRLIKCNNICDNQIHIIKRQITKGISKKTLEKNIITVFNTGTRVKSTPVEIVVFTKTEGFSLEEFSGKTVEIDILDSEKISGGTQVIVTAEGEKQVELPGYFKHKAIILKPNITEMSYKSYKIIESSNRLNKEDSNCIENEFYKIDFNEYISLVNKEKNEHIKDLFLFEDTRDGGDSYDYSPVNDEKIIINNYEVLEIKKSRYASKATLIHKGKLYKNLNSNEKEDFAILTTLELRSSEEFIRVNHKISNNVKDHRLRVIFNTRIKSKVSFAHQGFSIIQRENKNKHLDNWRENGFAEAPVGIYALENFALIKDSEKVFGLITEGIKEYEILNNTKFALTLFRSVGLLGRDDLAYRPGRASGINNKVVYTEDAEMLKDMEFNYGIYFGFDKADTNMFNKSNDYIKHYTSYQNQDLNLFEERLERFSIPETLLIDEESEPLFKIENTNIFVSTIKEGFDKDSTIVRIYNPGDTEEETVITSNKLIFETNLYEEVEKEITVIKVKPKGYKTIKIK